MATRSAGFVSSWSHWPLRALCLVAPVVRQLSRMWVNILRSPCVSAGRTTKLYPQALSTVGMNYTRVVRSVPGGGQGRRIGARQYRRYRRVCTSAALQVEDLWRAPCGAEYSAAGFPLPRTTYDCGPIEPGMTARAPSCVRQHPCGSAIRRGRHVAPSGASASLPIYLASTARKTVYRRGAVIQREPLRPM